MDLWSILGKLDDGTPASNDLKGADRVQFRRDVQWIIPQWFLASNDDADHATRIAMFDEFCNRGWSVRKQHPELHDRMLAAIGTGRTRRKFYHKRTAKDRLYEVVRMDHPDATDLEIAVHLNGIPDLKIYLDQLGFTKDEIKEVLKGHKK